MIAVRLSSIIAAVFGLMTVISGSAVLFTEGAIQKSAGNYVEFVVWFNLLSGFGYMITGFGLWKRRKWSVALSITITIGISVILLVFGIYAILGGVYELRTFYALTFRMALWLTISVISCKKIVKSVF